MTGTSTIREIAQASGVGRPDTYRGVVELEKKGLIEKTLSAPNRYTLLSLHDVLSILVGRRETESLELQDRSASLLEEFEKKSTEKQHANESQLVLIPSGKVFLNRLRKSVENSKESFCLIAHQKTLTQLLDSMQGPLKRAIGKEVNVRIVTEKRKDNSLTKRLLHMHQSAHFEFRFVNILPPFSLAIFDGKEILLSTRAQSESDKSVAVYSNNSSFVELSQSYFNEAWFSASEYAQREFKSGKLQFDYLFANMVEGFAYCKMMFDDEGKPTDFVFLQVNEAFERISGLTRRQVIGKRASRVSPEMKVTNPELFQTYLRVSSSGKSEEFEVFIKPYECWRHVSVYSPKKGYFALVFEDITERKKAENELKQRYNFLESLGENVNAGLAIVDRNYKLVWANKMLKDVGACPGKQCYQTLAHVNATCPDCGAKKIFDQSVLLDVHEYQSVRPDGTVRWVELRVTPLKDKDGNITAALELAVPIDERKKAEVEREVMIEFLKIANAATSTRDLIKASTDFFQKQSGCEAVGIRLKDGDDYPYYETRGFPAEHVKLENRLCAIDEAGSQIRDFKGDPVLECMCGNVICGRFDPSKKFFTEKGSFWTNNTTELLATTTDEERQIKTRNRCNGEGYESVALLALRIGDDRLGLLQLNDKRKNVFTLETVQTWERIADHLALALSKTISKESLAKYERDRTRS